MRGHGWLALVLLSLPLLVPRGPGGTGPVDVPVVLMLLTVAMTALMSHRRPPLPALAPLGVVVLLGLASLVLSPSSAGMLALTVDAYLVLLFLALACLLHGDERALVRVLSIWSVAAVAWGLVLLGTHYGFLPSRLDQLLDAETTSRRAAAAARNPNLAASYLATSVFVVLATPWARRRPLVGSLAVAVLVLAVWASGSNGALLALAVAGLVLLAAVLVRRVAADRRRVTAGVLTMTSAAAVALLLLTTGVPGAPSRAGVESVAQDNRTGAFSGSLGRLDLSVSSRERIWGPAWQAFLDDPVLGVGPGQAQDVRRSDGTRVGKGLHNDYLAFLVERGVLGLLALLWLLAVVLGWCRRVARSPARTVDRWTWHPAPLAGAVVVNLVIAATHESLHFRHLWVLLALTWVASALVVPSTAPRPEAARTEELHRAAV